LKLIYISIFYYNCYNNYGEWIAATYFVWAVPKSILIKIRYLKFIMKLYKYFYFFKEFLFPKSFRSFARHFCLCFLDYLVFAEPFFEKIRKYVKKPLENFYYNRCFDYVDFKHYLRTLKIRSPNLFFFFRTFLYDFFFFSLKGSMEHMQRL
jgi:hypothetical protein